MNKKIIIFALFVLVVLPIETKSDVNSPLVGQYYVYVSSSKSTYCQGMVVDLNVVVKAPNWDPAPNMLVNIWIQGVDANGNIILGTFVDGGDYYTDTDGRISVIIPVDFNNYHIGTGRYDHIADLYDSNGNWLAWKSKNIRVDFGNPVACESGSGAGG